MKAKVIDYEYNSFPDFCYWHGGMKVHDTWYDPDGNTSRFLTSDKRHHYVDTYSYVYISKDLGPCKPMLLVAIASGINVATCEDEEGDMCYILCHRVNVGEEIEFEKLGFMPYVRNPELNRFGSNRDD